MRAIEIVGLAGDPDAFGDARTLALPSVRSAASVQQQNQQRLRSNASAWCSLSAFDSPDADRRAALFARRHALQRQRMPVTSHGSRDNVRTSCDSGWPNLSSRLLLGRAILATGLTPPGRGAQRDTQQIACSWRLPQCLSPPSHVPLCSSVPHRPAASERKGRSEVSRPVQDMDWVSPPDLHLHLHLYLVAHPRSARPATGRPERGASDNFTSHPSGSLQRDAKAPQPSTKPAGQIPDRQSTSHLRFAWGVERACKQWRGLQRVGRHREFRAARRACETPTPADAHLSARTPRPAKLFIGRSSRGRCASISDWLSRGVSRIWR